MLSLQSEVSGLSGMTACSNLSTMTGTVMSTVDRVSQGTVVYEVLNLSTMTGTVGITVVRVPWSEYGSVLWITVVSSVFTMTASVGDTVVLGIQ